MLRQSLGKDAPSLEFVLIRHHNQSVSKYALDFTAIYTDGACSGNPGPGGWGTVVLNRMAEVRELGGGEKPTTNNRMEVRAALEGLRFVAREEGPVHIYTDSTYLIRGITQWVWGWKRKGWKTAEGKEVLNRDLWEDLIRVVAARGSEGKIEWIYVRGHTGNPGNERCDRIAVGFSQGTNPGLFRGPVKDYKIDILSFPESEGLPEMRPKEEKKAAYSYVSVLNGVVMRHRDWPSCEKRVKGQSGAKFKKSQSAQDEAEILGNWGYDPSRVVDDK